MRRPLAPQAALAAALGALQSLACVHTALWWLPMACAALLVLRLNGVPVRAAALLGWAYGTGWLVAGVWWLYISLHRYGGLPAWMTVLAVLLLVAALSLYLSAACAAYARWRRGSLVADSLLFSAVWLLAELARGVLFTGFPWVASGYSQVDAPLASLAPWLGVYGIGAVMALVAAGFGNLGQLMPGRRWRTGAGLVAAVALVGVGGPINFTEPAGRMRVTLVQTGVPQDEKFAAERLPATLSWLAATLQAARGELVLAPETAIPLLPEQLAQFDPGWWDTLRQSFAQPGRHLLLGLPLGDYTRGYTNSVAGLSAQAAATGGPGGFYRYDKHHLVPFGELIPPGFRWFTELMNIPLGDFARGPVDAPSFVVGAQRVAPNICYEDLFGEDLAVRFVDSARAPTVLANVSNIGWFGDTIALPQHLNITRLRTLELQRPMLRATNTGVTAIVDANARVVQQLAPFTRGVLDGSVEGRSGTTPFAWWAGRFGLWPPLLLALSVVGAAARRRSPRVRP
ncbi:MAG TPA: apolipoprotein N-acyltransferase [Rubrivivax sp.]